MKRVGIFLIVVAVIAVTVVYVYRQPPYEPEVRDWHDLQAIRYRLARSYILMNDLDSTTAGYAELASETANQGKGWQPIGTEDHTFTGTFDGGGYEIRDLFVNRRDEDYVGLFGFVDEGGVIENVGLVNTTVNGDYGVGGLVGENEHGTVNNSYSSGNVTGQSSVGGLVGFNRGTVSNSYFSGNVTSNSYVGGLVGWNSATVSNSYYNYNNVLICGQNIITIGALFAEDFNQWLANDNFLDINERLSQENAYYLINDVSDFKELLAFGQDDSLKFRLKDDLDLGNDPNFYIPYLAGAFDGNGHKILNLSFHFDFVSQVGLFGYLASGGRVTQVGVENVSITGRSYVGGLVGASAGTVNNSYSSGSMTGESDVGGLVGLNAGHGTVTNSYSTGNVTGVNSIGGLLGGNAYFATVSNSYSSGSVIGSRVVGGLVGSSPGTVSNCYSTGSVTGEANVGGLVALNFEGTVRNSHSRGSVTRSSGEDTNFGGFAGVNWRGKIINCYSTGSVHYEDAEDPTDKGFAGSVETGGDYEMTGNFWDTVTSGQTSTAGNAMGKTTAEMQETANFTDWDVCDVLLGETNQACIWNIIDGETSPFLSWQSVS